jgi:hypothetical protein
MQKPVVRVFFLTTCTALALVAACGDDGGRSGGAAGTAGVAGHAPVSGTTSGGSQSAGGQSSAGKQSAGGQAATGGADDGASNGGNGGLAGEGGRSNDAGASDAGADSGGVANGGAAGVGDAESGGAAGTNTQPEVPEELQEFESAVAGAVAQAQKDGSKNCARAIPAVPVSSVEDAWVKVRDFVALVVGVKPAALKEDSTKCNLPATAPCANLFQNDVYHSDGRLGDALHPFAQQVDTETNTSRVVILVPHEGNVSQPPVVVTAGVSDGFLMGLAFFDGRATCE